MLTGKKRFDPKLYLVIYLIINLIIYLINRTTES